jgi:hypothetical protein
MSSTTTSPDVVHDSHPPATTFNDMTLVSAAGIVPAMMLAISTRPAGLTDRWVTLPGYFGPSVIDGSPFRRAFTVTDAASAGRIG